MWTPSEKKFLKSLNGPTKVQNFIDNLVYNPEDAALSPRYVMHSGDGHCFEGALFAAAAMELQGHRPLLVDLCAHNDDDHVIYVYKARTGWGSISKSNTTLLGGREPFYKSIRELVMSYFNFYFNLKGELSLKSYSDPINLNKYNHWNWRTSDSNLEDLGRLFYKHKHHEILGLRKLKNLPKVKNKIVDACFLGANLDGVFKV